MKLLLIQDYLVGSRVRPSGTRIDTDRELGELLIDSGIAIEDGQPVRKKKRMLNLNNNDQ